MSEAGAISMRIDRKEELRERVAELTKVSTIPSVLKKIIEVIEDKSSTVVDLERVIERDQAIASRLIAASNAAFYGFPRKICSISQAVLVLGFEMVKGLAISTAVFNGLSKQGFPWLKEMWCHSFETAIATSLLAGHTGSINKETAFMAGLLHDIGRPILYQMFGSRYADISVRSNIDLTDNEEEAFGATHADVGTWFTDRCMFPVETVDAIRFHHCPEFHRGTPGSTTDMLVPIVYLANIISTERDGVLISTTHARQIKKLNLTPTAIDEVEIYISKSREDIKKFFI